MWGGQDSVEPHQLWGNPGQSQNAWNNGGSGHSMNYQPRSQQQWQQNQIHMQQQQQQQQQQQWGYQQHQHAAQQWQMPPQQMGWSNSPTQGYAGYEEKKMPGNRGYSGYGYGGMQQSMAAQPQAWHGQRDMYQRQQWDNSMRPAQNSWAGNSSSSSSQWQNDWQTMRETENTGSGSPGLNSAAMTFDTWPGVGATGPTEEGNIMWRDPKPKKKIRDTGVQLWGDPTIQTDKILRWKEADHEDFQKGPSTSTWNQLLFGLLNISSSPVVEGGNPWVDQSDSIWPANIWESSEAVLAEDPESRALHYPEDGIRGFSKADFVNAGSDDMNGSTVYALQNAYQRAINTGLLPMDIKKHPQDTKFMSLVNTLLQKMVKEEQAETELEHIRQIMARGDYPVTVSQEHERISAERDGFKTEITILSDEIKNNLQGGSWLMQWQKRNTSLSETSDGLTAALQSMGISEETPKMPNPAPWVDGAPLVWNEVAPISINTDLDRPSKLEDGGSGERKGPGPQEFVPGKKWEWTDPAKVAEDPNATPGSVQPSFASPNWGNGNCDPWTEKSEKKSSTEDSLEK